MTTTTSYGTWSSRVNTYETGPAQVIDNYINGGDDAWRELLMTSGALAEIERDYRNAIDTALPADISLCGDEFIGPAYPEDGEFDGYPVDDNGDLDFADIIESIDLAEIIEANEPITLEEIGRDILESKSQNPAKAASVAMGRLALKPQAYVPHPESGRPQAIYLTGTVRRALAGRERKPITQDSE